MLASALSHWRTSLAGVVLILIAVLHTFFGINIPNLPAPDLGTAITLGLGLIVASDGAAVAGKA